MLRFKFVLGLLCISLVAGCKAYDDGKLDTASTLGAAIAPPAEPARQDTDAGTDDGRAASCGNGRVDRGESCDISIAAGETGACPDDCDRPADTCSERTLSGSGCRVQCIERTITRRVAGDGCCPEGSGPAEDGDCGTCGDSVVSVGETCDPPSMCPTRESCAEFAAQCLRTRFSGSPERCDARCEILGSEITACQHDDTCCPSTCSNASDNDCSAACGDGVVDSAAGETCESGAKSSGCDLDCDDGNPCTRDARSGSADNCNVRCSHVPILAPANADGCCPAMANAGNDSDCMPRCGNGVQEPGEACDGGDACDASCQPVTPDAGAASPDDAARCAETEHDPCANCGCMRCEAVRDACRNEGPSERKTRCRDAVDCGVRNVCIGECSGDLGCFGRDCWFGRGYPTSPLGPCVDEISSAAGGSRNSAAVHDAALNDDSPLYYAERYAACLKSQCADACEL